MKAPRMIVTVRTLGTAQNWYYRFSNVVNGRSVIVRPNDPEECTARYLAKNGVRVIGLPA